jgi:cell division protein FtsB
MNVRTWLVAAFAFALAWIAAGSVTGANAGGPSVSSLQQTVISQGKLISQLQTRVSALERSTSGMHAHVYTHAVPPSKHMMVIPKRHTAKIEDLGPGLATLQSHHASFLKLSTNWPHIYPLPTPPPTIAQLAAQEAQMAAQEAQLAQEVSDMKNELTFDENYLYSTLTMVRDNVNVLGNQEAADVTDLRNWLIGCDGGLGMSWAGWKYHINDSGADNQFICSGNPQ